MEKHTTKNLYEAVSKRTGFTYYTTRCIIESMHSQIEDWVSTGDKVTLAGFGSFYRGVISKINLRDKTYPARFVARFRSGSRFKKAMGSNSPEK